MSSVIKPFADKIYNQVKNLHRHSSRTLEEWKVVEESKDYYGIMPPLERFMEVPVGCLSDNFWKCIDVGDIVIGRVASKLERGLQICLLCFDAGKSLDIENLEISAHCPISEIPTLTNHEDPLSRFSITDLVRAEVIRVLLREEQLIISFRPKSSVIWGLELGVITDDILPVAYKRTCINEQAYHKLLHLTTGFYNPNVVKYLKNRLIPGRFSSLIKDLQTFTCPTAELASSLRKRQSSKVASRSVAKGINFYRKGMMLEALQELNLALNLDPMNSDALVARGALYANKRTFSKAIADFEKALNIDPSSKNAMKYLVEVLIERAKSIESAIEDLAQVKEAATLYRRALHLDPDCAEAKTALGLLEKEVKQYKNKLRRSSSTDSASSSGRGDTNHKSEKTATIQKVRELLKHDIDLDAKDNKKISKRKRSTSSSSSSSSSSSTSSSSESDSKSSSSSTNSSHSAKTSKFTSHRRKTESSVFSRKRSRRSSSSSRSPTPRNVRNKSFSGRRRSSSDKYNRVQPERHRSTSHGKRSYDHVSPSSRRVSFDYAQKNISFRERRVSSSSSRSARRSRGHSDAEELRERTKPEKRPSRISQKDRQERNSLKDDLSKDNDSNAAVVPITKITKDNFTNILDQITKFEKRKSLK